MIKDKLECLELNAIWWDLNIAQVKLHYLILMVDNCKNLLNNMWEYKNNGFHHIPDTAFILDHSIFHCKIH